MCLWGLHLIFKAKLKLRSGNWKIQYGCQVANLEVTSLKIYRHLPIATNNMYMKFDIAIAKQTWVTLWKPCHQWMDGWMDGQTDKVNPVYPPPHTTTTTNNNNFVGGGDTYGCHSKNIVSLLTVWWNIQIKHTELFNSIVGPNWNNCMCASRAKCLILKD